MGLAWVFVLAGLVWPFLHLVGGKAEPDSFFIPVMIGGPAFLVSHVLAFRALRSKSIEAAATARRALRLIWIGITILLLLGLGSFVFDRLFKL